MIPYPSIKPYIVKLGPLQLRWYGMMYLMGFLASYLLFRYQNKKRNLGISGEDMEGLYFYMIAGLVIGARLGYVVFYNLGQYIRNPLEIFAVWHGGMSFHGGLIGSIVAMVIFTRSRKLDSWVVCDMVVASGPIGLFLGRMGNFINAELYGRPSDVPWAMVFPGGGPMPRHPSQLYEALLEGVLMFIIIWWAKDRIKTRGAILPLFLALYGVFRFGVEFVREPDMHMGFVLGSFTMGQVLSASMVIAAGVIYYLLRQRDRNLKPA